MVKTRIAIGLVTLVAIVSHTHGQQDQVSGRFEALLERFAAQGIVRHADIRYDEIEGVDPKRLSLDVYTRPDLRGAPVLIFVHGGSWQRGDKRAVWQKPLGFVPEGFVVVSTNYRFRPDVEVPDMARDIATAVAWIKTNIGTYGGDPETVFLMGHSAGAHLVALVGTNGAYLKTAGLLLEDLSGVIPLDTGPYNVTLQLEVMGATRYGELMRGVFTEDPEKWPAASPWDHVEAGKGIPPFLVFYHDGRGDAPRQAIPFVERLKSAGVDANVVEAEGKTHGSLNQDLGQAGDVPTEQSLVFLKAHCNAAGNR